MQSALGCSVKLVTKLRKLVTKFNKLVTKFGNSLLCLYVALGVPRGHVCIAKCTRWPPVRTGRPSDPPTGAECGGPTATKGRIHPGQSWGCIRTASGAVYGGASSKNTLEQKKTPRRHIGTPGGPRKDPEPTTDHLKRIQNPSRTSKGFRTTLSRYFRRA